MPKRSCLARGGALPAAGQSRRIFIHRSATALAAAAVHRTTEPARLGAFVSKVISHRHELPKVYFALTKVPRFCDELCSGDDLSSKGKLMASPPLDPRCSDLAPKVDCLTNYDEEHLVTYLRLLDAYADGADWVDVARTVLHIDAQREPDRARSALSSHLERARWIEQNGYRRPPRN
jgi:hypothetical protein